MPDATAALKAIRQSATSVTSGWGGLPEGWRSGPTSFVPRSDRFFGLAVELDQLNLPSLPERMIEVLHQRLLINIGSAADKILADAGETLYKPDDFPLHKHGYDTGRMKDELTAHLTDVVGEAIIYDFFSGADYWVYVEFGHMLRDGSWWPGYHFLTSAVMKNYQHVQQMARVSLHETFTILAAQSRTPGGGGAPYPDSSAPLADSATAAGMGPVGPGGALLEQDL